MVSDMTSTASVLKVRTPGEIAALVPHLTGFVPHESLVAISLRGSRKRIGLTLRADLVDARALVDQVVTAMTKDGARSVALVVHTDQPSGAQHPWTGLVDAVEAALAVRGVDVPEVLLVRDGRWWSYRCVRSCCPATGSPLAEDSAVVQTTATEQAYEGRVVLASRAELVASLQSQLPLGPALLRRLQDQAEEALAERLSEDPEATVQQELARWRCALDGWEQQPRALRPDEAGALAVGLHLVRVRDSVASWSLDRLEPLLGLLQQLCRGVIGPHDAPLCAVLAWVAYASGNGALALIAAERALASDPAYSLAQLLLAAIDGLLPPDQVRAVLQRAA